MNQKYKNVFFDLDRTLWDFEKNAERALTLLFEQYDFKEKGIPNLNFFLKVYKNINAKLWRELGLGKINKEQLKTTRFEKAFLYFGIVEQKFTAEISEQYLEETTKGSALVSGAIEILDYLCPNYDLYILSNGFKEAQYRKLETGNMKKYFKAVFLSDEIGFYKPDKRLFEYALKEIDSTAENTIMIGDDLVSDIQGAKNAGLDSVLFDPQNKYKKKVADFKISRLAELKEIL